MGWLLAAAVFLLTTAIVFRTKSPKNAFLIAAGALLSIVAALVLFLMDERREGSQGQDLPVASISLSDVRLTSDRYGRQLSGRVTNEASRRLGTLSLRVTFSACKTPSDCQPAGSDDAEVFLALPAGQTGGFSVLLPRRGDKPDPGLAWKVEIIRATADF